MVDHHLALGRSSVSPWLARRDGLYATSQLSVRVEDLSLIGAMVQRIRTAPLQQLAGSPVVKTQDLAEGSVQTTGLPPTEGMLLLCEDDTRVIVRPSGTEPKLKCYLEVVEQVAADADQEAMGQVRRRAAEHLERITEDLRQALGQS